MDVDGVSHYEWPGCRISVPGQMALGLEAAMAGLPNDGARGHFSTARHHVEKTNVGFFHSHGDLMGYHGISLTIYNWDIIAISTISIFF